MNGVEMVRFRCPPQCNSYRIATYFVAGIEGGPRKRKSALSHRCLDCGRAGTTFLNCDLNRVCATLGDTHWEESEERAAAPTS